MRWMPRSPKVASYCLQIGNSSEDLSLYPEIEIAAHPSLGNFLGETNVAKN